MAFEDTNLLLGLGFIVVLLLFFVWVILRANKAAKEEGFNDY